MALPNVPQDETWYQKFMQLAQYFKSIETPNDKTESEHPKQRKLDYWFKKVSDKKGSTSTCVTAQNQQNLDRFVKKSPVFNTSAVKKTEDGCFNCDTPKAVHQRTVAGPETADVSSHNVVSINSTLSEHHGAVSELGEGSSPPSKTCDESFGFEVDADSRAVVFGQLPRDILSKHGSSADDSDSISPVASSSHATISPRLESHNSCRMYNEPQNSSIVFEEHLEGVSKTRYKALIRDNRVKRGSPSSHRTERGSKDSPIKPIESRKNFEQLNECEGSPVFISQLNYETTGPEDGENIVIISNTSPSVLQVAGTEEQEAIYYVLDEDLSVACFQPESLEVVVGPEIESYEQNISQDDTVGCLVEVDEHVSEEIEADEHVSEEIEADEHVSEEIEAGEHVSEEIEADAHVSEEIEADEHVSEEVEADDHDNMKCEVDKNGNAKSEVDEHVNTKSEVNLPAKKTRVTTRRSASKDGNNKGVSSNSLAKEKDDKHQGQSRKCESNKANTASKNENSETLVCGKNVSPKVINPNNEFVFPLSEQSKIRSTRRELRVKRKKPNDHPEDDNTVPANKEQRLSLSPGSAAADQGSSLHARKCSFQHDHVPESNEADSSTARVSKDEPPTSLVQNSEVRPVRRGLRRRLKRYRFGESPEKDVALGSTDSVQETQSHSSIVYHGSSIQVENNLESDHGLATNVNISSEVNKGKDLATPSTKHLVGKSVKGQKQIRPEKSPRKSDSTEYVGQDNPVVAVCINSGENDNASHVAETNDCVPEIPSPNETLQNPSLKPLQNTVKGKQRRKLKRNRPDDCPKKDDTVLNTEEDSSLLNSSVLAEQNSIQPKESCVADEKLDDDSSELCDQNMELSSPLLKQLEVRSVGQEQHLGVKQKRSDIIHEDCPDENRELNPPTSSSSFVAGNYHAESNLPVTNDCESSVVSNENEASSPEWRQPETRFLRRKQRAVNQNRASIDPEYNSPTKRTLLEALNIQPIQDPNLAKDIELARAATPIAFRLRNKRRRNSSPSEEKSEKRKSVARKRPKLDSEIDHSSSVSPNSTPSKKKPSVPAENSAILATSEQRKTGSEKKKTIVTRRSKPDLENDNLLSAPSSSAPCKEKLESADSSTISTSSSELKKTDSEKKRTVATRRSKPDLEIDHSLSILPRSAPSKKKLETADSSTIAKTAELKKTDSEIKRTVATRRSKPDLEIDHSLSVLPSSALSKEKPETADGATISNTAELKKTDSEKKRTVATRRSKPDLEMDHSLSVLPSFAPSKEKPAPAESSTVSNTPEQRKTIAIRRSKPDLEIDHSLSQLPSSTPGKEKPVSADSSTVSATPKLKECDSVKKKTITGKKVKPAPESDCSVSVPSCSAPGKENLSASTDNSARSPTLEQKKTTAGEKFQLDSEINNLLTVSSSSPAKENLSTSTDSLGISVTPGQKKTDNEKKKTASRTSKPDLEIDNLLSVSHSTTAGEKKPVSAKSSITTTTPELKKTDSEKKKTIAGKTKRTAKLDPVSDHSLSVPSCSTAVKGKLTAATDNPDISTTPEQKKTGNVKKKITAGERSKLDSENDNVLSVSSTSTPSKKKLSTSKDSPSMSTTPEKKNIDGKKKKTIASRGHKPDYEIDHSLCMSDSPTSGKKKLLSAECSTILTTPELEKTNSEKKKTTVGKRTKPVPESDCSPSLSSSTIAVEEKLSSSADSPGVSTTPEQSKTCTIRNKATTAEKNKPDSEISNLLSVSSSSSPGKEDLFTSKGNPSMSTVPEKKKSESEKKKTVACKRLKRGLGIDHLVPVTSSLITGEDKPAFAVSSSVLPTAEVRETDKVKKKAVTSKKAKSDAEIGHSLSVSSSSSPGKEKHSTSDVSPGILAIPEQKRTNKVKKKATSAEKSKLDSEINLLSVSSSSTPGENPSASSEISITSVISEHQETKGSPNTGIVSYNDIMHSWKKGHNSELEEANKSSQITLSDILEHLPKDAKSKSQKEIQPSEICTKLEDAKQKNYPSPRRLIRDMPFSDMLATSSPASKLSKRQKKNSASSPKSDSKTTSPETNKKYSDDTQKNVFPQVCESNMNGLSCTSSSSELQQIQSLCNSDPQHNSVLNSDSLSDSASSELQELFQNDVTSELSAVLNEPQIEQCIAEAKKSGPNAGWVFIREYVSDDGRVVGPSLFLLKSSKFNQVKAYVDREADSKPL